MYPKVLFVSRMCPKLQKCARFVSYRPLIIKSTSQVVPVKKFIKKGGLLWHLTYQKNTATLEPDYMRDKIPNMQRNYEQSFLEISNLLLEVKNTFEKHGDWLAWLNHNIDLFVIKAHRLMKVSKLFQKKHLCRI